MCTPSARGSDEKRIDFGGVIYTESAEKAARFILDCNQNRIPLIFLHDVNGFMVGKDAEWSGIIRAGAKMVNAVSNSVVPKISVIFGGSFGAGNYAMCGKAYDPRFIFAWPTARYAVMSGDAAAEYAGRNQDSSNSNAKARSSTRRRKRNCCDSIKRHVRASDRSALRGGALVGGRHYRSRADARRVDLGARGGGAESGDSGIQDRSACKREAGSGRW